MKKIEAIIRPFKVDDVKEGLTCLGDQGMTVSEVKGFGRHRGQKELFREAEYQIEFLPKLKIEIAGDSSLVKHALAIIQEEARTRSIGDGKRLFTPIEQVVCIRIGEKY